uniref:Uncharacterized protein n=1 Tax=Arundo donax TaxID=35708 RepID=A0A0A9A4Y4_ARUDO
MMQLKSWSRIPFMNPLVMLQ